MKYSKTTELTEINIYLSNVSLLQHVICSILKYLNYTLK